MTSASGERAGLRVAITGGTGVLGRHLLHHLQKHAPDITPVVLTRSSGLRRPGPPPVEVRQTDYSRTSLGNAFQGVDAVIHLAASRSSSPQLDDHLPTLRLAETVFLAAAEAAADIIFASSISVYGTSQAPPWSEDSLPAASGPYGISKFAAERIGSGIAHRSNRSFAALRFSHLYGAGESNGYMVNVFMDRARKSEPLHLHAPARAKRDFLYAADAAMAIERALRRSANGVFNIGSGNPATNHEIADAVVQGFDSSSEIVVDHPHGDEGISPTLMTTERAEKELGFHRQYSHADAFREIHSMTTEVK